jgi:hypothetical protein
MLQFIVRLSLPFPPYCPALSNFLMWPPTDWTFCEVLNFFQRIYKNSVRTIQQTHYVSTNS